MAITRRQFIKGAAVTGAALALPLKFGVRSAFPFANSGNLTKWWQPLRGLNYPAGHILGALGYPNDPNGIPVAGGAADPVYRKTTMYQIGVQPFADQLHPNLGQPNSGDTLTLDRPIPRHLGGSWSRPEISQPECVLRTSAPQLTSSRWTHDPRGNLRKTEPPLTFMADWCLGSATGDRSTGLHRDRRYATGLSFLNGPGGVLDNIPGSPMVGGQADYFYPNNQSTRLLWYHDHAHGITRINAYAGIASAYLIVDLANDAVRLRLMCPILRLDTARLPGQDLCQRLRLLSRIHVGQPGEP